MVNLRGSIVFKLARYLANVSIETYDPELADDAESYSAFTVYRSIKSKIK